MKTCEWLLCVAYRRLFVPTMDLIPLGFLFSSKVLELIFNVGGAVGISGLISGFAIFKHFVLGVF